MPLREFVAATIVCLLLGYLTAYALVIAGLWITGELHRGWPALISLLAAALAGSELGLWIRDRITLV